LKRRTHLLFGVGSTLFFFSKSGVGILPLALVSAAGALIPDADLVAKHRSLMHNVFSLLLFSLTVNTASLALGYGAGESLTLASAGAFSYATHLLLDSLTVRGVNLFWPLASRWYGARSSRFDSRLANAFFSLAGIALAILSLLRS